MPTRAELVAHVRFALSNLSARNGHHEFEALCLEVARQSVTPNVIPATGPVAGRGDQGRDFETFRSRVTPRLGTTGLLLGLDGHEIVAFACTLQRRGLQRKTTGAQAYSSRAFLSRTRRSREWRRGGSSTTTMCGAAVDQSPVSIFPRGLVIDTIPPLSPYASGGSSSVTRAVECMSTSTGSVSTWTASRGFGETLISSGHS